MLILRSPSPGTGPRELGFVLMANVISHHFFIRSPGEENLCDHSQPGISVH